MPKEYTRQVETPHDSTTLSDIVLHNNFPDGVGLTITATGTDWEAVITKSVRYTGNTSLKLQTRTTGATAGDTILAEQSVPVRRRGRAGGGVLYQFEGSNKVGFIEFGHKLHDNLVLARAAVRYDVANAKWQYLNSVEAWADVTGGAQDLEPDAWHTLYLSVNVKDGEYNYLNSNKNVYSLVGISVFLDTTTEGTHEDLRSVVTAGSSPPGAVHVDTLTTQVEEQDG